MQKLGSPTIEDLSWRATDDPEWFWEQVSRDVGVVWDKPYSKILDVSKGIAWSRWFVGGRTNMYRSSVERFAEQTPEKTAYTFVAEDGETSSISYLELDQRVSRLAKGLKSLGVKKGDVVAVYMPMIEEAILAILAAAKIGAISTVISSGYDSESVSFRLRDCNAKILFVTDGYRRMGADVSQRGVVDMASGSTPVGIVIVVPYRGVDEYRNRDGVISYDEVISGRNSRLATRSMNSEDPLFILHTPGTVDVPKGVIQTHGGFSVFAGYQAAYLTDMRSDDVLFWPADIGCITGLVWNVYGLLMTGASAVIYDGSLAYPDPDRVWEIASEYKATIFGTSPAEVEMFMNHDLEPRESFKLSKIRNVVVTGEPIDDEPWLWLLIRIGNDKVPVTNMFCGTEIGGAMLSVLPVMNLNSPTVGMPVPGMDVDVVDNNCDSVWERGGQLVVKSPWPAMTRGLLNDRFRYLKTYWSRFENVWFQGDYMLLDNDGMCYAVGRADEVMDMFGDLMSSVEIESAAMSHREVSGATSVTIPDDVRGGAMVLFVVPTAKSGKNLESGVSRHMVRRIGEIARPKRVFVLPCLPLTGAGKVIRRVLEARLLGEPLGDLSTVQNAWVLEKVPELDRD